MRLRGDTARRWAGAAMVAAGLALVAWKREALLAAVAGPWGWAAVVALLLLSCAANLPPASAVVAAAGAAYGVGHAILVCGLGLWLGALLPFALARSLLRQRVAAWARRSPRVARLDRVVAAGGWRAVALLRLSPVLPFGTLSYALGATALSWRDYLAGNAALVPPLALYVSLGAAAGEALRGGRLGALLPYLLGIPLLALTLLYLRHLARGAAGTLTAGGAGRGPGGGRP